jgi:hypothetical protein
MTTEAHLAGGALRERMIEDMRVRGFVEKTRRDYARHVRTFAAFIGRPPDTATAGELRKVWRVPELLSPEEVARRGSGKVSPHTLRHSFATHLLEQNIDIRVIEVLLGHAKLDSTAHYTRVATSTIRTVMSLLDRLGLPGDEARPEA